MQSSNLIVNKNQIVSDPSSSSDNESSFTTASSNLISSSSNQHHINHDSSESSRPSLLTEQVDFESAILRVGRTKTEKVVRDSKVFPLLQKIYTLFLRNNSELRGLTFPELMLTPYQSNHDKSETYSNYRSYEDRPLKKTSRLFGRLNLAIEILSKNKALGKVVSQLQAVYEEYRSQVISTKGKERRRLFKGRVRVVAFLHNEPVCLLLPQRIGRTLTCRGPYGDNAKKAGQYGANAVFYDAANGLFLKRGTTTEGLSPGLEQATHQLTAILSGFGSPPTHLIMIIGTFIRDRNNHFEHKHAVRGRMAGERLAIQGSHMCNEHRASKLFFGDQSTEGLNRRRQYPFLEVFYTDPIQVSKGVLGISLLDALDWESEDYIGDQLLKTINQLSFSRGVVLDLLCLPSDARTDNFQVSLKNIVEIDYDRPIGTSFLDDGYGTIPEAKAIRLLLDPLMHQPIAPSYRKRILNTKPEEFLLEWITRLNSYNRDMFQLRDKGLLTPNDLDRLSLPVRIDEATLPRLYSRLTKMQAAMKDEKLTHWQLFEAVDPLLHAYYRELLKRAGPTVLKNWVKGMADHLKVIELLKQGELTPDTLRRLPFPLQFADGALPYLNAALKKIGEALERNEVLEGAELTAAVSSLLEAFRKRLILGDRHAPAILNDWVKRLTAHPNLSKLMSSKELNAQALKMLPFPLPLDQKALPYFNAMLVEARRAVHEKTQLSSQQLHKATAPLLNAFKKGLIHQGGAIYLEAQASLFTGGFGSGTRIPSVQELLPKTFLEKNEIKQQLSQVPSSSDPTPERAAPTQALVQWLGTHLQTLKGEAQAEVIKTTLTKLPSLESFILEGLSLPSEFVSTLFRDRRKMKQITIARCQGVTIADLMTLYSTNKKLSLTIDQNPAIKAQDLVKLIDLSRSLKRPLFFRIGNEELSPITSPPFEILKKALLAGQFDFAGAMLLLQTPFTSGKESLIHLLAKEGSPDAIHFLVSKGKADPNQTHGTGRQSPMHVAAEAGRADNIELLRKCGAMVDTYDLNGRAPLHLAILQDHTDAVKALIKVGAKVDQLTKKRKSDLGEGKVLREGGESVLHLAVSKAHKELILYFLNHRLASKWTKLGDYCDGKTPLHALVKFGDFPDIANDLLKAGVNAGQRNNSGFTALHWCAMEGRLETAQLLLKKKAPFDVANHRGDTPFDLAIRWGHDDIAYLLLGGKLEHKVEKKKSNTSSSSNNAVSNNLILSSSSSSSSSSNQTGSTQERAEVTYSKAFLQAYNSKSILKQIFYLYKTSHELLEQKKYREAALVLNSAAPLAAKNEQAQRLLETQRERIEGRFLFDHGVKTSNGHRGQAKAAREELAKIRGIWNSQNPKKKRKYTELVTKLLNSQAQMCIKLIGKPSPQFSWVGFGAIARGEMLPYSPFASLFLVAEGSKETRDYLECLKALLEIRLINLGETAHPILRKQQSLAPAGFSHVVPGHGIANLIGTPQSILSLLSPQWLENNPTESQLVDAITTTALLCGDSALLQKYQKASAQALNHRADGLLGSQVGGTPLSKVRGEQQITRYVKRCVPGNAIEHLWLDAAYPIQLLVDGLTDLYGLRRTTIKEQIVALRSKGKIGQQIAKALSFVWDGIEIARIRQQLKWQGRNEEIAGIDELDQIQSALKRLHKTIKQFVENNRKLNNLAN